MFGRFATWFRQQLARRRGPPHRAESFRRLLFEPLERRSLLTVSVTFDVAVTNLPGTTGSVPVIGAEVSVYYVVNDGYTGVATVYSRTNSNGSCAFDFADGEIQPGSTLGVYVTARYEYGTLIHAVGCMPSSGSYAPLNVSYEVDKYVATDSSSHFSVDGPYCYNAGDFEASQASQTYALSIDANKDSQLANAFAIF
jgi:hypothetical protein